jgi:serine/threonine-protein kinase
VIVTLGLAFVARGGPLTPPSNASSGPSVAVLPFTVIGGDTSDSYFAAGMADELTAVLATVPGLRVASRTAAFAIQDRQLAVADIGETLNVATLLEGTIRREGSRLRVSVRLIEADDGLTRWSQQYQREITDVFAVQDDIAQAIVGALQTELGDAPASSPQRERGTSDLTAYDFYLRGRYFFHKRGAESLHQALSYFERAAAQDPDYALAYSGMADVYGLLPLYGSVTNPDSVIQLGLAAASRAIEIDSTLAEAYASRGNLRNGLWRWSEAAADYRSAIALRPGYATAHQWYGENRLVNGKVREAVAALGRARDLDPLSPIMAASYGVALGVTRQDSAALEAAQGAVELDTTLAVTRMMLGTVHLYAGRFEAAIAEFDRAEALLPANLLIQGLLGYAYARGGRSAEATTIMAAIDPAAVSGSPAIARIQLGLGEPVAALASLGQAARQRDPFFGSESLASPIFDPLRDLPEFTALVRDVGLDDAVLAGR